MKIYIVGIGMDGVNTITENALNVIKSADLLIGAERILKPFQYLEKQTLCTWKADEIEYFLRECDFQNVAVLMSGDCGFYSGAKKIMDMLKGFETEIISGISSPVYFCSRIKKSWQNMKFISLHGVYNSNIVRNVCCNEYCFFLLGGDLTVSDVCRQLCNYEMGNVKVYVGENLGYENERISSGTAEDFINFQSEKLAVMITENNTYEKFIPCGISDEKFIRGNVPMTKSEVRCVAVSKLDIRSDDICWDIGCGTGSVSVEMALKCFDGNVFALDKNHEAVKLTSENAYRFGCDNIRIISAAAPECLEILPKPDKVFIGGSCGKIDDILGVVFEKNPNAKVVVTAVSLETLASTVEAFEKYGTENPEVVQIAVTRTRKVGAHTMLSGENPVFIIKGVRY